MLFGNIEMNGLMFIGEHKSMTAVGPSPATCRSKVVTLASNFVWQEILWSLYGRRRVEECGEMFQKVIQ